MNARLVKNYIGSIGSAARSSRERMPRAARHRPPARRSSAAAPNPAVCACTSPNTMPSSPGRAEREAGYVERSVGTTALGQRAARRPGRAPAPIGTLMPKIQCQFSTAMTAPPTSGPSATAVPLIPDHTPEREAAPLGGEGLGEQRQRQRRDHGGADALDRPCRDQHAGVGREPGERGCGREDRRGRRGTRAGGRSGRRASRRRAGRRRSRACRR